METEALKKVVRNILSDMVFIRHKVGWKFLEARNLGALEALLCCAGIIDFNAKLDYGTVTYETRRFLIGPKVTKSRRETYSELIIRKANEFAYQ